MSANAITNENVRAPARTATANAAELLGMEESVGRVAPGYYADLVAVEGNPLEDISVTTRKVVWVMKGGEVMVDRAGESRDHP